MDETKWLLVMLEFSILTDLSSLNRTINPHICMIAFLDTQSGIYNSLSQNIKNSITFFVLFSTFRENI